MSYSNWLNTCFAVVSGLALIHCAPSESAEDGEEGASTENAFHASSAGTLPPEEAMIGYLGTKQLVSSSGQCLARSGADLYMTSCWSWGTKFAVYQVATGVEFCIPGTLQPLTSENKKARDLEMYVATCLEATFAGGVKMTQLYPLSWRRLGSTGPFSDNRRGQFEIVGDGSSPTTITLRSGVRPKLTVINSRISFLSETVGRQNWTLQSSW